MLRLLCLGLMCTSCALLFACANPASTAPKAVVSNDTLVTAPSSTALGERLEISPENSKIAFVGSKVTGTESGSFEKFFGAIELVDEKVEKSRVTVEIDMHSVITDSKGLAEHLKTGDFFEVERFPKATFASTEIKTGSGTSVTHLITGTMDLHGVKKVITFPATIKVAPESISFNSEFSINRKDFGIVYAGRTNDLIRDEVLLKLSVKTARHK